MRVASFYCQCRGLTVNYFRRIKYLQDFQATSICPHVVASERYSGCHFYLLDIMHIGFNRPLHYILVRKVYGNGYR